MQLNLLSLIPFIVLSPYTLAKEPPKKFTFQVKEVFDARLNKNEYESLINRVKEYQSAYLKNESIGDAVRLICKNGFTKVEGISPMIFKEAVEFQSEYEVQYFPITDFNPSKFSDNSFPTYKVECGFKTKKSDSLPRAVKVRYREVLDLDQFEGSYEQKITLGR